MQTRRDSSLGYEDISLPKVHGTAMTMPEASLACGGHAAAARAVKAFSTLIKPVPTTDGFVPSLVWAENT